MKTFIVNSKDLCDKKKNPHFILSPARILKNKKLPKCCPECGGKLREVDGDNETLLWCEDCDVSMDSSGGYTK